MPPAKTPALRLLSRAGPSPRGPALAPLLAAALLAAGCSEPEAPGVLVASGHVEATEMRLATKNGGTLVWFPLEEGDRVEEGREIARTETVDFELTLAAARAERAQAEAQLRLLEAGFRPEEIAQARAALAGAEVELAAAQVDLARFQGLLDSGSGTEKSRDDARARRDAAAEAVEVARQRLGLLERGFRREEIEAARARRDAAEARIAEIEQRIRDATVVSPTSGVVTETLVEQGEILPPGATLAVLTRLDDAWLTAWVGEPDLGRLRLGQEAEVITDGGETRSGRLTWVSPRAEFTPKNVQTRDERVKLVYKIKIALDNRDGLFKPGMPAQARVDTGAGEPAEPEP